MRVKGISYDIGIVFGEYQASLGMDEATVRKEMKIIRDDLHMNAIRLSGTGIDDMITGARICLEEGLDVWLSPHYIDVSQKFLIDQTLECGRRFEELRKEFPERECIYVIGCEFSCFAKGFTPGDESFMERMARGAMLEIGPSKPFTDFVSKLADDVREVFKGKITYAAQTFETVDWSHFDYMGIDFYRDEHTRATYEDVLKGYINNEYNKPFIMMEFGLGCFKGCSDKGAIAFMIVDQSNPGYLNGQYERCEKEQADELVDLLTTFDKLNVEGSFLFTFSHSGYPYNEDPMRDMDMAGFGIVKCYPDKFGTVYPEHKWDPKEAFYAVADYYAEH